MRKSVTVSIVVGVLFMVLAFWGINFASLASALSGASYVWVVPALGVMVLLTLLRSYRLQFIFRKTHTLTIWSLFCINSIGFAAINLLPARLGEFLRPYLLLEEEDIPLGAGLAAVLVERLFDFLALVVMIFTVALVVDLPSDSLTLFGQSWPVLEVGRRLALFMALPAVAFVVGLFAFQKQVLWVAGRVSSALLPAALARKVVDLALSFVLAVGQIRDPRTALGVALWTLILWLVNPLGQLCVLYAFSIPLGYDAAFTVLTTTLMGLLIPAPPGFAGNFEAFNLAGLSLFGVVGEIALAYALVCHGVQFVSTVGLGLLCLWREGISFTKLVQAFRDWGDKSKGGAGEAGGAEGGGSAQ